MRKLYAILLIQLLLPFAVQASHITGGEMFYTYAGYSGGLHRYNVTLKLYQRCNSGRQFPNPAIISVFDKSSGLRYTDLNAALGTQENIAITSPNPCITNPPVVCFDVAYYYFTVEVPPSASGYVIASQVNFRINGINNLQPGYSNVGATYTAEIPGTGGNSNDPDNTSAVFTGSDLVVVCANNDFSYSFAAFDPDGDQLRYTFCSAYASSGGGGGNNSPPNPPPFPLVSYNNPGFNSNQPFGINAQINPNTGMITGMAPDAGIYVVTVCVQEVRQGRVIATQRKDIQINVADCNIAAASLKPEYMLCKNTQTITLANQSSSPLITSTSWDILDASGSVIYSAATPEITYTFPVAGVYRVKLVINRNQTCSDSTESVIRVFPGFVPDFSSTGICLNFPTQFTDQSTSVYGVPDSWQWDFGEDNDLSDVSAQQNPSFTYPLMGLKNIRLIVTDTRGCRDTIIKSITIIDKPPIALAFRDSLICRNDQVTLQATGSGNFNWTPGINIINPNTASPTVLPTVTTRYFVRLTENNCTNTDSVLIRVVNQVSLQVMADTTICQGDTIRLHIVSDGLQYTWTPAPQVLEPGIKNPLVVTGNNTTYQVTARIGGCNNTQSVAVRTVPYPEVNAGPDLNICYNTSILLSGSTDGNSWSWQPAAFLTNAGSLNPLASPPRSTVFILTATNNRGCPKPGRDTVLVSVEPRINLRVTPDTTVVIGQPLQLNAAGGLTYNWSPPDNLNSAVIANPVAGFTSETPFFRYKVITTSHAGCRDSAFVNVKVFRTLPSVFVPTAFTPNNDGRNDILVPIAAGMKQLAYFNVYNRWGQLVFTTQQNGQGWDGKVNGGLQSSSTYVWTVKAVDYTGRTYFNKGLVTLIR